MAGTNPAFDGAAFRDAIHLVYDMAAPPLDDDKIKFYFPATLIYNRSPVDGDNVPFDPTATVTRSQPAAVQVSCAVEYFDANGEEVVFGTVTASRIVITLLDEDYVQIKGFSYVVLAGQRWDYKRTAPPAGLFDVGLWEIHCQAEDQI